MWDSDAAYDNFMGRFSSKLAVHIQCYNCRSPDRSSSDDGVSISRPTKVILPLLHARIEERHVGASHGINSLYFISFSQVTRCAGKSSVKWEMRTTIRSWKDVVEVKTVTADILWRAAILTPPIRTLFH